MDSGDRPKPTNTCLLHISLIFEHFRYHFISVSVQPGKCLLLGPLPHVSATTICCVFTFRKFCAASNSILFHFWQRRLILLTFVVAVNSMFAFQKDIIPGVLFTVPRFLFSVLPRISQWDKRNSHNHGNNFTICSHPNLHFAFIKFCVPSQYKWIYHFFHSLFANPFS